MEASRDLVIVGGGPAGLTTALAIARRAPRLLRRLVVLEASTYPRDKYCAGALGGRGEIILERLDASPRVASVHVDGMVLVTPRGEATARPGRIGRVIRRKEFDAELAAIAKRAGIEISEGTRVTNLEARAGGARLETTRGAVDAALVIGADGVGSVVRRAMGLGKGGLRAQVLEVDTEQVASDRDRGLLLFDTADHRYTGYAWDFPTVASGEALVCRGIYHLRCTDADEPDIAALFGERLAAMGLDLARCKNKRFAERGFEPRGKVAEGAMILVGEAAGVDPVTGEGIAQAIEAGALAGAFVVRALERGEPFEGWSRELGGSRLARDLAVRHRAVMAFYGPERWRMERFLTRSSDALHVGAQHFGGLDLDRRRLATAALRGSVELVASAATRAMS